MNTFMEFFAGGGMARVGLGNNWVCNFANDIDPKKMESYRRNFGEEESFFAGDIADLSVEDLPKDADLAWASFPCQDLSLAGNGKGLKGERSGTFWFFWNLISCLKQNGSGPRIVAIENVVGLLTSNAGFDFARICSEIVEADFWVGGLVVDASPFVPQSRPRLFLIAVDLSKDDVSEYSVSKKDFNWGHKSLFSAFDALPTKVKNRWIWWRTDVPAQSIVQLSDILEPDPVDVKWHSKDYTHRLLGMMSGRNSAKITRAQESGSLQVFTMYRRTRQYTEGRKVQRIEVRDDGLAGCLRTPSGGSSRQLLIFVENDVIRTRLMSKREAARLMGLPDEYILPANYNEAYHLAGDGVVVPVVDYLNNQIFDPILRSARLPNGWLGNNFKVIA